MIATSEGGVDCTGGGGVAGDCANDATAEHENKEIATVFSSSPSCCEPISLA
jgi:hypothetical protein